MARRSKYDIALEVLRETKLVKNWVKGELKFMEIDPGSEREHQLTEDLKTKYARIILQQD